MKVYGKKEGYSLINKEFTSVVVNFGYEEVDDEHATWYMLRFNKKQGKPTFEAFKRMAFEDVNADIENQIITTFSYNGIPVWLGRDEQSNYTGLLTAFQTMPQAWQPYECKFGTDDEPVYYTFETFEEYHQFCLTILQHKSALLNRGWRIKDAIDWSKYEEEIRKLYDENI